jgi:hypothetical protein
MEKGKEIAAKIIKVGEERAPQDKRLVPITIQEKTTGKSYDVTVWLNDDEWSYGTGTEVTMEIRAGKEYKGKKQYSSNIKSITPTFEVDNGFETAKKSAEEIFASSPKEPSEEKPNWDIINLRDYRSRTQAQIISKSKQEFDLLGDKEELDSLIENIIYLTEQLVNRNIYVE